jgi:microcystin degradation protein MlrC
MGQGGAWQNFGLSALLRVGEVELVVISNNGQLLDLAQISSMGVDPFRKNVIVCKSK